MAATSTAARTRTKQRRAASAGVVVEGVVLSDAIAQPGDDWYVMMLVPWRHPDGRLLDEELRVGRRRRVELVIDRVDGLLAAATARVLAVEEKQAQIRAAVARRMVPLYNTRWREARPRIDAAGFDARLKLSTIEVGDGRTTLYYGTGTLFGDHGVEVRLGARGAISEILIS